MRFVSPLPRHLGCWLASAIVTAARFTARRRGVVIDYHGVGDPQGDWTRELVPALGTRLFESQLSHLAKLYRVVPAARILEATRNRRRGERFPVAITFDDDLSSHERIAAPQLERLGLPAAFFLTGASLDEPFTFWWEHLQRASDLGLPIDDLVRSGHGGGSTSGIHSIAQTIELMPIERRNEIIEELQRWVGSDGFDPGLSRSGVSALARAGFEIGFHTADHARLTSLDEAAQESSMTDGRARLAAAAGVAVNLIAYPHGAADARTSRAAASAGYRLGFTTEPEPVTADTNQLLIGRVGPSYTSAGHFALKMAFVLMGRAKPS